MTPKLEKCHQAEQHRALLSDITRHHDYGSHKVDFYRESYTTSRPSKSVLDQRRRILVVHVTLLHTYIDWLVSRYTSISPQGFLYMHGNTQHLEWRMVEIGLSVGRIKNGVVDFPSDLNGAIWMSSTEC